VASEASHRPAEIGAILREQLIFIFSPFPSIKTGHLFKQFDLKSFFFV